MTLPVVNFEDYRGLLWPAFNLNARLLKWGASYIFANDATLDNSDALLQNSIVGLNQIKFSRSPQMALIHALDLYHGARTLKPKLQTAQPQKYCDALAYYILINTQDELKKEPYQLSRDDVEDYEDMLKQLLSDYGHNTHHDEKLRAELLSDTYQTITFMRDKFGIVLGRQRSEKKPVIVPH